MDEYVQGHVLSRSVRTYFYFLIYVELYKLIVILLNKKSKVTLTWNLDFK